MITALLRRGVKILLRSKLSSLWVKVGLVQENVIMPAPHARYRGVFDRVPRPRPSTTGAEAITFDRPFEHDKKLPVPADVVRTTDALLKEMERGLAAAICIGFSSAPDYAMLGRGRWRHLQPQLVNSFDRTV